MSNLYTKLPKPQNYQRIERKESDIKYLVIHYTANNGDTAKNNVLYYSENVVKASAHFFVDDIEVCCSVPWYYRAWHCGGYKYPYSDGGALNGICTNSNSIGIELCSRKTPNGLYYFTDAVIERAAKFVAQQMKTYHISIDNVVRHYDVTGKHCPAPFVDYFAWREFKAKVMEYYHGKGGDNMVYYETLNQIPAGEQREIVAELVKKGVIKGNEKGLHLSSDMTRLLVFLKRLQII